MILAQQLAKKGGFATRRGAFCAHPYVWRLMHISDDRAQGFAECTDVNSAGMIRVSFGIYNTEDEVEEFLAALPKAIEEAKEAANNYSRADPRY